MDTKDLFRATLAFERDWREAGGRKKPTAWGAILQNERYPHVQVANLAWVESLPRGGPEEVLADLDEAFGRSQVAHRCLIFSDPLAAYEVQEDLARQGFRPTAELAMAKVGLPSCIVNPDVEIRRLGEGAPEEDYRRLWAAIDVSLGYTGDVSWQRYELQRERAEALGWEGYVAYLKGAPAGIFTLWPRGLFVLIDNVGTHPDYRMRGVGRTMIFDACNRAIRVRCEYAVLTADLFDTPQLLYKTLGFEPVGEIRGFVRR